MNEAVFKGLAHSPCREPTQTQLQRGPRGRPPLANWVDLFGES